MKNKLLVGGAVLILAMKVAWSAETMSNTPALQNGPVEFYRAKELSVDAFGSASVGAYTINHVSGKEVENNTRLGAGAGLNYFFTRNIGLGADLYSEDTKGAFIDSASANLILRLPLGEGGFAPFIYGGGGRQFDLTESWFCQLGAGLEYRFTAHVGAFLDARWVLPEETEYYGVARLGLRFAF